MATSPTDRRPPSVELVSSERDASRRAFLAAAAGWAALLAGCSSGRRYDPIPADAKPVTPPMSAAKRDTLSPDAALRLLREGNDRFASGQGARRNLYQSVKATAAEAHPFATVVCCSDALAVPEVLFDQSIGDIFTTRVFGHVPGPGVIGSVEYAALESGVRLVVVLGHERCDAIETAIRDIAQGTPSRLALAYRPILDRVSPEGIPRGEERLALPGRMARAHVAATVRAIVRGSDLIRTQTARGQSAVLGAMLEAETGRVSFDL